MWDTLFQAINKYYVLPSMAASARPRRLAPALEAKRLAALERYQIIDTEEEELFNATVRLASSICATSMASISFIDSERQWLKAHTGYPVTQVPRDLAFCSHTILEASGSLVIEDASLDSRFSEHPFVANAPHMRFYAGMTLKSDDGEALGTLCVMDKAARPLTQDQAEALDTLAAQVMIQLELRRSNKRLRVLESAIRQSNDAIVITTLPTKSQPIATIDFVNAAFSSMSGFEADAMIGRPVDELPLFGPAADASPTYRKALTRGLPGVFESAQKLSEGNMRHFETSLAPIRNATGSAEQIVAISRDISERKHAQAEKVRAEVLEAATVTLAYAASHDSLTNIWNRPYFLKQIERIFGELKSGQVSNAAVMFLDLDRFKVLNDGLGHLVGDTILVETAARLQKILENDGLLARLGGDEFTILLTNFEDEHFPLHVAQRFLDAFTQPFYIAEREIYLSVSIGIASIHPQYTKPEDVLRDADAAMYRAKAQGKNRYERFTPQLHADAVALMKLEHDLRLALTRRELTVFYQPVISLEKSYVLGFEALVRWRHPTLGMVSPVTFIDLAEETGIIVPLGMFVLEEAIRQCIIWNQASIQAQLISVSVNVSSRQLKQAGFSASVLRLLQQSGLPNECLKLEVTESIIATDSSEALETLEHLKQNNIQIHMDDFGTGYSSFSYLDKLPIAVLKIDRSFVSVDHASALAKPDIVRAIISMAKTLALLVTAEGVETAEQAEALHAMGCDHLQGYLFSKPMQASQTLNFLKNYVHAVALPESRDVSYVILP